MSWGWKYGSHPSFYFFAILSGKNHIRDQWNISTPPLDKTHDFDVWIMQTLSFNTQWKTPGLGSTTSSTKPYSWESLNLTLFPDVSDIPLGLKLKWQMWSFCVRLRTKGTDFCLLGCESSSYGLAVEGHCPLVEGMRFCTIVFRPTLLSGFH